MNIKVIETINTLLFIGGGFYTMWYIQNSVRVNERERLYIKGLLQERSRVTRFDPEMKQQIISLEEKF